MGFIDNERFNDVNNNNSSQSYGSGSNRFAAGDVDTRTVNLRSYNEPNNRGRPTTYNDGMQAGMGGGNNFYRSSNGTFPRRDFVRYNNSNDRMQGGTNMHFNGNSGAGSSYQMQEQYSYRKFNGNNRMFADNQQQNGSNSRRMPEAYEILDDNNIVERSTLLRKNNNFNGQNGSSSSYRGGFRANYDESRAAPPYSRYNNNNFGQKQQQLNSTNYQRQYSSSSTIENDASRSRGTGYSNIAGNTSDRNTAAQFTRQVRRFQPYGNGYSSTNNYAERDNTYAARQQRTFGSNNTNFRRNFNPNGRADVADAGSQQQHALVQDRYRCHIQPPLQQPQSTSSSQHTSRSSTNLFAAREQNGERGGSLSRDHMLSSSPSTQRRRSLTPVGNDRFVENFSDDADRLQIITGDNNHSRRRRNSGGVTEDDRHHQQNNNKINGEDDYMSRFRGMTRRRQSSYTQRELSPSPSNNKDRQIYSSPLSQRSFAAANRSNDFVQNKQSQLMPPNDRNAFTRRSADVRRSLVDDADIDKKNQPSNDVNDTTKSQSALNHEAKNSSRADVKITLNVASSLSPGVGVVAAPKPLTDDDDDDLDALDDEVDMMDNASEFILSPTPAESPLTTTSLSIDRPTSRSDGSANNKPNLLDVTLTTLKPPSRASSTGSSSQTLTTITTVPSAAANAAVAKSAVELPILDTGGAKQLPSKMPESLLPLPFNIAADQPLVNMPKISDSNLVVTTTTSDMPFLLQGRPTITVSTTSFLTEAPAVSSSLSSFMESLPTMLPELTATTTSAANISSSIISNVVSTTTAGANRSKKSSMLDFDYADPRFDSAMLTMPAPPKNKNNIIPASKPLLDSKSKFSTSLDSSSVTIKPVERPSVAVAEPTKAPVAVKSEAPEPDFGRTSTSIISPPANLKVPASVPSASITSSPRTLAAARTLSFMSTLLPSTTTTTTAVSSLPAAAKAAPVMTKSFAAASSADNNNRLSLFSKADTPVVVVKQQPQPEVVEKPNLLRSSSISLTAADTAKVGTVSHAPAVVPKPPPPPVISDKDKKKFDKFIRFVKDSNGGCTSVQVQWADVVEHFTSKYGESSIAANSEKLSDSKKLEAHLQQFVHYFYTRAFEEDENGFPRYTMGILRGAARTLPCLLNFLERRHANMSVKVGSLLNDNETLSKSLREFGYKFREGLDVWSGTSNTCGPMHAISCVGRKGEESGALLNDLLDVLENHVALRSVMPWGECSHLYGMQRGQSDDGPILWIRPGEQTIAAAELADAEWRGGVSDPHGAEGGMDGTALSGSGSSRRGGIGPRLRRELKDLGLSAYSRFSLQPHREHVYEDRTRPHADHAGGGSLYLPTAAVGILKAIQPRVYSNRPPAGLADEDFYDAVDRMNNNSTDDTVNNMLSESETESHADKNVAESAKISASPGKKRRQRQLTDGARSAGSSGGGRASRATSRASDNNAEVEADGTTVSPDFVHGRITKDVVCFDAKSQQDLSNLLQVDYFEKPVKQCAHFVSWPKLNWLRRQGIKYSRLFLEDGDIYVIPRGVVHQFNTVAAVCSIAWHVRLRQYYEGEIVPFSFMLTANKKSNESAAAGSSPSKLTDSTTNAAAASAGKRKNTTLADAYTSTPADHRVATMLSSGKQLKKHRTLSGSTTAADDKSESSSVKSNSRLSTSSSVIKKKKRQHRFNSSSGVGVGAAVAAAAAAKAAKRLKKKQNKLQIVHTQVPSLTLAENTPASSSVSSAVKPAEISAATKPTPTMTPKPISSSHSGATTAERSVLQPVAAASAATTAEREKIKRYLSLGMMGSSELSEHEAKKLHKKLKKQHKQQQLELMQQQQKPAASKKP